MERVIEGKRGEGNGRRLKLEPSSYCEIMHRLTMLDRMHSGFKHFLNRITSNNNNTTVYVGLIRVKCLHGFGGNYSRCFFSFKRLTPLRRKAES